MTDQTRPSTGQAQVSEPWALLFDVQGTKSLSLQGEPGDILATAFLSELTSAIYKVGSHYGDDPQARLFAYQFGDAFLVVPNLGDRNYDRAASIGIGIMRALVRKGVFVKVALSFGALGDRVGCLDEVVYKSLEPGSSCRVNMGSHGLMIINPVYGPALSRAFGVACKGSGPRFLIDPTISVQLTQHVVVTGKSAIPEINWVKATGREIDEAIQLCGIKDPPSPELVGKVLGEAIEAARRSGREVPGADKLIADLLD